MAEDDVYRRLQRHLDRMSVPFPATDSGIEIRILERLFSREEARLVLELSMMPETAEVVHRRLRRQMTLDQLRAALDSLGDRGLITRIPSRTGGARYAKAPMVVGFYEAQVNRLTPEIEREFLQYFDEGFAAAALHSGRTPQMRTVPVTRTIPLPERTVARYDDIAEFVRTCDGPFAVMNCICQQGKDLLANPCSVGPNREHCLMFGTAAKMLVDRGPARFVSRDEMLALLEQADRDGLVLQPQNTQKPMFVCCCCGCCCGVLTTAKKLPRPADFFATNFQAQAEPSECQECGTCATRCQMDAVTVGDDVAAPSPAGTAEAGAVVDSTRCIGCGLCVSTCPSGAMKLVARPQQKVPPADTMKLYGQMYRERYGPLGLLAAIGRGMLGIKT